ncbi:MAG: VOC family protein [Terriglobia bacterium]|jgi:predicted enzyme related to lactoylglutathione lyase
MKRVNGLGGIFFKADHPEKLYAWYEKHLGLQRQAQEAVVFNWRQAHDPEKSGMTVWAIFPKDTKYFDPSRSGFMMNFIVEDLDGLLAALREEGVEVDPRREDYDYGRFAWIMDPEGNRIELWEPPKKKQSDE